MAKPKKVKTQAAVGVMQSRDEVIDAVAKIGELVRERTRIETAMNDEMAAIKAQYEMDAQPHGERITALSAGVQAWCEAHRMDLTQGGKTKTVQLPTGEVKWRVTPPSVSIKGTEAVLQLLRNKQLVQFIRAKEEVNKEAILADPKGVAGIAGITIKQVEEFVIEPFSAQLDEVA
jgi:phage host-nuclease inhibitor protein Gam